VEQHVKILAILNIVLGAMGVAIALIILLIFGGLAAVVSSDAQPDAGAAALLGGLGGIFALIVGILALPCLIAGVGLLKLRPWAQTLGIVVSVLNLPNFPFGTALGAYGLWVLLNKDAKPIFRTA
jgi:hypothetical protein